AGPPSFSSGGSVMGQVPGEVVAAAFGVFNPAVVIPLVAEGWTRTDATTLCATRTEGAVGQLQRILGEKAAGGERANELLARAGAPGGWAGAPAAGAGGGRPPPPRGKAALRRPGVARPAGVTAGRRLAPG